MPTKMNRSEQQPYVPKGDDNGGEYRSYGYGGNSIPKGAYKKIKPKKQGEKIQVKVEDNGKDNNASNFIDFINKTHTKNSKEFNKKLIDQFNYGQKEGKDLINKVIKDGSISYTKGNQDCSWMIDGSVTLSSTGVGGTQESGNYSKGGVFYHETYHAIDANFKQPYEKAKQMDFRHSASATIITSNGKTLCDTLIGKQKPPIGDRLKQAQEDLAKFEQEFYDKNYPNLKDDKKELESIYEEAKKTKEYQDILEKKEAFMKLPYEERSKRYSELNEYRNKLDNILEEYKRDEQKELREKISSAQLEFRREKLKVWGDVSDMFCMQGYGYVFGMGHSTRYAGNKSLRGVEFFAECGSAENTNPQSLKLIKKYFPEGYKAYREIIDGIKSGKYKSFKQQKEAKN